MDDNATVIKVSVQFIIKIDVMLFLDVLDNS